MLERVFYIVSILSTPFIWVVVTRAFKWVIQLGSNIRRILAAVLKIAPEKGECVMDKVKKMGERLDSHDERLESVQKINAEQSASLARLEAGMAATPAAKIAMQSVTETQSHGQ